MILWAGSRRQLVMSVCGAFYLFSASFFFTEWTSERLLAVSACIICVFLQIALPFYLNNIVFWIGITSFSDSFGTFNVCARRRKEEKQTEWTKKKKETKYVLHELRLLALFNLQEQKVERIQVHLIQGKRTNQNNWNNILKMKYKF